MDWNEVKEKPKKKTKKPDSETAKPQYGGKKAGGKLVAGPIQNANLNAMSGHVGGSHSQVEKHAAAIAEYEDYCEETAGYEEIKYETVSTQCAHAISQARTSAKMTQGDLAKKAGIKPGVLVDIENGTARYEASLINAIEKALGVHIPRGRKKK